MTITDRTVIDPEAVFFEQFGESTNFMSPEVVFYQLVGRFAVELSRGAGFSPGTSIYGVTVLEMDGRRTDLSQSFGTHAEAIIYLEGLA